MKNWLPYNEAREIVLKTAPKFGINTERKWLYYKKYRYNKPNNIPRNPDLTYKNNGWKSWSHWLGTKNIQGQLKKYSINHNFFKKWSCNMAYILGFWWADGCIRKRIGRGGYGFSYGFGICQNEENKYILQRIMNYMGANNPIWQPKSRPKMCHFEIASKTIFKDIVKLGGQQRKSLITSFPKIPKKYIPDFVRGLFDGDGCISIYANKCSASCYICSGSGKFLKKLRIVLIRNYNIFGRRIYSDTCFRLYFSTENLIKLGKMMYYKGHNKKLRLERKYNRFFDLFEYRKRKYANWRHKYGV